MLHDVIILRYVAAKAWLNDLARAACELGHAQDRVQLTLVEVIPCVNVDVGMKAEFMNDAHDGTDSQVRGVHFPGFYVTLAFS